MKRVLLLVGIAFGIIAGSKFGRQPYEKVQKGLRTIGARPEVRKVKDTVAEAASDLGDNAAGRLEGAKGKVQAKLSS